MLGQGGRWALDEKFRVEASSPNDAFVLRDNKINEIFCVSKVKFLLARMRAYKYERNLSENAKKMRNTEEKTCQTVKI